MIHFIINTCFKKNSKKSLNLKKINMGVGGIFIGTLALIFAIIIVVEIKERFF